MTEKYIGKHALVTKKYIGHPALGTKRDRGVAACPGS